MCLQTTWTEPKVAEEDILVYKLVREEKWENTTHYFSPYVGDPINYILGEEYTAEMEETRDDSHLDFKAGEAMNELELSHTPFKNIGSGLHCAKTKERLQLNIFNKFAIIKAIIPKGSKYYEGLTDLMVSEKLIILKEQ